MVVYSKSKKIKSGGGWPALVYSWKKARRAGGIFRLYKALRSRNACKTCALGMGGQRGGMVNETGRFPSVCKKSIQAMTADMQGRIRPDFFEKFSIRQLQDFSPRELEMSGRLVEPLLAGPGDTHYHAISWDEAFAKIAAQCKATPPDESFFYFSGRSSNEAGFLLQLFARLYGTNHVNNCSYYCHQASGVGLTSVTGSGTATIVLEDLNRCDLLFLIGGNPASNHPRLLHELIRIRRRGGKVVVINPIRELGLTRFKIPSDIRSLLFGSRICDEYLQPHIAGDIALLTGIGKCLLEQNAVARDFIDNYSEGWKAFERKLTETSWETIVNGGGVQRADIERIARLYADAECAVFAWTMGITHHEHGVQNVQMIGNLALMRGMIGKPGAGLMPIRGHSNVQGIGSVGVTPKLKDAIFERLEKEFSVTLPTTPGLDTLGCLQRAAESKMRLALCLGGNLYGASPDANFTAAALARLDLVVYLSTTLNTGHAHGRAKETLILPVLARDEEPQPTTQESMFNYVRLSDGGPPRHTGPMSEVAVISRIARDVLGDNGPVDFAAMQQHQTIRQAIGKIIPGFEAMNDIDRTRQEFQIGGRTFHQPKFKTPSGKARFHAVDLPNLDTPGNDRELRLMTIRSEGQFNTVVYEEEDIYRRQERRDVVLMNEQDIRRLELQIDQPVSLVTPTGRLDNLLVRQIDIPPGNAAIYYPESNVLVPQTIDPASRTPAFKNIKVTIEL